MSIAINRAALWCGGGGLRAGACVVLQVAAKGKVQGQAARQLFVAVGQQGFFEATGAVIYIHIERSGVCIAILLKPHTALRRLAVQPRTVFGGAPGMRHLCVSSL